MHVVIFEDATWHRHAPAALSRPLFCLRSGAGTLLDKQLRHLHAKQLTLWVRPGLVDFCRASILPNLKIPVAINVPLDDEPALLVSGQSLLLADFEPPPHAAIESDPHDSVRAVFVQRAGLSPEDALLARPAWLKLLELPRMTPQTRHANYLWDLIAWNQESLLADAAARSSHPKSSRPKGAYHLVNDDAVHLADNAAIAPGVVFDASAGPVIVDAAATIGANSVLLGPCHIGAGAVVQPLTLIRPGTSVAPQCKVAGEISNAILDSYTNKAHYGYLGDSYVGQWVNLGAGTTTSNLKNTYGPVTIDFGDRQISTGRQFLGSLIGDHTKTAIATRLLTGSYVGYSSMISTTAPAPRHVPSFTFLTDAGAEPYRIDKAIDVVRRSMDRKHLSLTPTDEQLVRFAKDVSRCETKR